MHRFTLLFAGFSLGVASMVLAGTLSAMQKKKPEPIDLRQVIERIEAKQDQLRDLLAAHDKATMKACAVR